MDHTTRVDAMERDLAALVAAVAAGPLDARVPSCPDFDVDALARHVGQFCGFWSHVLCEGSGRPKPPFSDEVGPEGRVAWLTGLAAALVGEMRATPPDTAVWTWYPPDQSAAFVARRCSHEVAVHRVDAQLARGPAEPVEAGLAADGIDEVFVLTNHVPRTAAGDEGASVGAGRTLHLHGTDHPGAEWLVTLEAGGTVAVEHAHAKGDLALRGPVSDLEMVLYQRPTVGGVDRFGDPAVLDAFFARFTFA